uniref:N-acetylgalactosaminide beta-1,3-galactosyltransferase n=1 Tax=Bursaphelenchus xylophilus TaxID=6326 RepID=A0A1I7SJR0_BURXY
LAVILDTWAKKCDDVLVFTDAPLEYDVPHVYFPMMNTRDHSWEKIRRVFRFAFEDMEKKYDWYLRADDDAYVLVDNARTLVKEHDPEKPAVLGYRWGFFEVGAGSSGS